MSQFSDLLAEVYTITNRSDLVAETSLALRQATLAAHRSDVYPGDMTEVLITPTAASVFSLDIPTLFPNWRQFAYIRPYDPDTDSPADYLLEFILPDGIFDEYLVAKVNVAYVAGTNLNIKLAADYGGFLVGYYQNPVLSPDASYSSWIATQHPACIIIDAAARVMHLIGYEDAASRLKKLGEMELALFRQSNLEAMGR